MRPLVVVGDVLLDRDLEGDVERICPDAPVPVVDERHTRSRPGGAGLAAVLAQADDRRPVVLVTSLGRDAASEQVRALLEDRGVRVVSFDRPDPTPEKLRIRAGSQALLRIDSGGGARPPRRPTPEVGSAIQEAAGILVADYGRGVAAVPEIRDTLTAVAGRRPVVWDPHPHGASPVGGSRLVTPNEREAGLLSDVEGHGLAADVARARALRTRWEANGVAITLGEDGAVLVDASDTPLRIPSSSLGESGGDAPTDPCGAGDRFAATVAGLLTSGYLPTDAVTAAVEVASDFVDGGGVASVDCWAPEVSPRERIVRHDLDPVDLAVEVRAQGGTLVATGGCFDLLHAGHVQMLEVARELGDCLIVCLNSDASIRSRKGPGRPVLGAEDRMAILRGLRCVDAVAVFEEPTPDRLLRSLRPHIWAKGADYTLSDLPEATTVAAWGGETVVLPYLEGRSTTELLKEMYRDA